MKILEVTKVAIITGHSTLQLLDAYVMLVSSPVLNNHKLCMIWNGMVLELQLF